MHNLSDARLRRWYLRYRDYYNDLPEDIDLCYAPLHKECANITSIATAKTKHEEHFLITINPAYLAQRNGAKVCILHELAHAELWPYLGHGARFDAVIDRLYAARLYRGLL